MDFDLSANNINNDINHDINDDIDNDSVNAVDGSETISVKIIEQPISPEVENVIKFLENDNNYHINSTNTDDNSLNKFSVLVGL